MPATSLAARLQQLDPRDLNYATHFADQLLAAAAEARASDIHLQPTTAGIEVRWRLDGVLLSVGTFSRGEGTDIAARLKVLARLLTYRTDIPQEGRIPAADARAEMRVSTFPSLYGERVVIRLFVAPQELLQLVDLGLPAEITTALQNAVQRTSGAVLLTGPAGGGKTTTAYACLRHVVQSTHGARSIVSLEDPIEVALTGVSQSQVNPAAGFDLASGLRALLRQDPEVVLLGEVRDQPTAAALFQAALTGQLVISTFHAGSVCEAISRLAEMGIEPYLLRSGLSLLLHQRLLRKLCTCGSAGCDRCQRSGYSGRIAVAELLPPLNSELTAAVLRHADAAELQRLVEAAGMVPIKVRVQTLVEQGLTSPAEMMRVLGTS
ncbi:Putative type II secretion system protein E [Anatilimnocola aggregata]|uniref:Type II secretion system protein E n=1 Tax=Anatilimnocola aggregata TaxID=2528021 RepID=A0A517Y7T9_9BACT|nr:ATPase, T2SS/T4P/T4SS family [Anatilimnocola aggregata]QDU26286.1 Putative type II secretion system protein E [Anatilimnocola aggregata]